MLFTEISEEELNEKLVETIVKNDLANVKALLQKGADSNYKNYEGSLPLSVAAKNLNLPMAMLLLSYKANPNLEDIQGDTPLHKICKLGLYEVEKITKAMALIERLIKSHADINALDYSNQSPLYYAIYHKQEKIFKMLLKNGANQEIASLDTEKTFLHLAVERKLYPFINMLIENKANIDAQDIFGNTPMHYAANSYGEGTSHIISILAQAKANLEILNKKLMTPLEYALSQDVSYAQILLRSGANPDVKNKKVK